jgi:hypothetical protein
MYTRSFDVTVSKIECAECLYTKISYISNAEKNHLLLCHFEAEQSLQRLRNRRDYPIDQVSEESVVMRTSI